MEWMLDPTAWLGLLTLITLEIVLGIDNLIFVALLVDKLPRAQQKRARTIGLALALILRLTLLSSIFWMTSLTAPLFTLSGQAFSGRDLVYISGGLFLLYKATTELHERVAHAVGEKKNHLLHRGRFWPIIAQIVVIDLVFSIDSIVTAVGMVDHLALMMIAVVIAVIIMMLASGLLADFINKRPTVIVLCLGFLMMIGFSLIADGMGFHVPKAYLYVAIGFSVFVETFNQLIVHRKA